jgi:hypothetical protein
MIAQAMGSWFVAYENGDLASDGRRRRAGPGDLSNPRINGLACLGFAKCDNAVTAAGGGGRTAPRSTGRSPPRRSLARPRRVRARRECHASAPGSCGSTSRWRAARRTPDAPGRASDGHHCEVRPGPTCARPAPRRVCGRSRYRAGRPQHGPGRAAGTSRGNGAARSGAAWRPTRPPPVSNARARGRLPCDHWERPHWREPLQFVGQVAVRHDRRPLRHVRRARTATALAEEPMTVVITGTVASATDSFTTGARWSCPGGDWCTAP